MTCLRIRTLTYIVLPALVVSEQRFVAFSLARIITASVTQSNPKWRLLFLQGLGITFVCDETDAKVLNDVQDRFDVSITPLPDEIDLSSYSKPAELF